MCQLLRYDYMVFAVDLDYLSPVLREQTLVCQSILQRLQCHLKCGEKKAICLKDKCFCVPDVIARGKYLINYLKCM